MRALRTAWVAVAAGPLLLAAVSCGVPDDDKVRTVDPSEVPYHLLDDATEVPSGAAGGATGPRLYWVDAQDELVGRPAASFCAKTLTGVARNILGQLGDGPSSRDLGDGLGTAMPPQGWLELVEISDRTAHLRVSTDDRIGTSRVVLATAQTVLSLTSIPGVDRVEMEYDAGPLQAPRSSGELADGPLRHDDYRSLLADPAEPPKDARLRHRDLCPG
ncbi:GerMN domain-containing protein [Nocardioides sp. KC13]|uniref:GerMN domain-containing protein n=1 Tax=Nocardioides turkmenicus TaxID=2711220 RepID=A0A6M1QXU2_9ACTN|nr:GerMN domain-containing protein [Nocardioides sp. KC13]NGN92714.1 GerMN domain-containing protein [Nocardioides sp. KC13]